MEGLIERTYTFLEQNSWIVIRPDRSPCSLPACIRSRYHNLPAEWVDFVTGIRVCVNPDENAWFLCANDFEEQEGDMFQWNELERISLQAAWDDKNAEWEKAITDFWDGHLPIYLSTVDDYEYYAIRMADGAIVHGSGPEFEETAEAAQSFAQFLGMICAGGISLGE